MSQTLARRARIKDLSDKAEGIFQYVGNDNVLFRLISTGNKLTSDVNYAVALFTGFARSHQLGSQETPPHNRLDLSPGRGAHVPHRHRSCRRWRRNHARAV